MVGSIAEPRSTAVLARPGAAGSGRVALFDLDRTLLPGSSLVTLGRSLAADRLLARRTLLVGVARDAAFRRRGASDGQAERLRAAALRHVAGLEVDRVRALVCEIGERLAAEARPGMVLLLRRHVAAGDRVIVLSASPQELVDAVATHVGAHHGIGTRAAIVDGRYTGELDGPFCYGPGKLARLRDEVGPLPLGDATGYADSASDVPILEACGEPVAVNPDRRLGRIATARGWPVVRFG